MKQCECRPIWETELTAAAETVLGGSFDESAFSKEIQQVTLYSDRIEFSLLNGNRKSPNGITIINKKRSGRESVCGDWFPVFPKGGNNE